MQRTVWQWPVSYKSGNLVSLIETTVYRELVFKNVWYDHIKIIIIKKKEHMDTIANHLIIKIQLINGNFKCKGHTKFLK